MIPAAGHGWNPLAALPLASRSDLAAALRALLAPVEPYRSPGAARVGLSAAGAAFDRAAAGLEGFARPFWGAAPAALGGEDALDWAMARRGLANGCDPAHPEFWGWPGAQDQRLVEMAAIGFAVLAVPDRIWEPLAPAAKTNVTAYLRHAAAQEFSPNNWLFFRLLIEAGLRRVGEAIPPDAGDPQRAGIEALYLGDGWYRDGPGRRVDHYTGFAFHTYGLLLHRFAPETDAGAHLARARAFAPQFAGWFDAQGRGLAYGRSMTYRFAMLAFFGAYALAETVEPVLPWGVLKGIVLRHLRWWAGQPIAERDGVLSVGYAYPNALMAENYNSACSPYWAFKAFLPLALPEDHPFWTAEELPLPGGLPAVQPGPGFLLQSLPDQTVALTAGQESRNFRHGAEKYAKFACSTRFPLCVEARDARLMTAALDNALGLQAEGRAWLTRQGCLTAEICDGAVRALWRPWPDVEIESWAIPWQGGHLRWHRITSAVALETVEGGFSVERRDGTADRLALQPREALVESSAISRIVDLSGGRAARIHGPDPHVSLAHPRVWVPQLLGRICPGETEFVCWSAAGEDAGNFDPAAALAHLARTLAGTHDWQPALAMTGAPDILPSSRGLTDAPAYPRLPQRPRPLDRRSRPP